MYNVHVQALLSGGWRTRCVTQPLTFEFQIRLMVTCKILNEGTALRMEQGRWVEDDGEGAESKKRRREKTFTCFVILILSPSVPEAGGGHGGWGFRAFRHPPSVMYTHDHKG